MYMLDPHSDATCLYCNPHRIYMCMRKILNFILSPLTFGLATCVASIAIHIDGSIANSYFNESSPSQNFHYNNSKCLLDSAFLLKRFSHQPMFAISDLDYPGITSYCYLLSMVFEWYSIWPYFAGSGDCSHTTR
jgi:hypothetical protein